MTLPNENMYVYSDKEIVIGSWFGKPLYRKVLDITANVAKGQTTIRHNISNLKKGISARCVSKNDVYLFPYIWNTTYAVTGVVSVDPTNITFNSEATWGNDSFYVILEYTKTTD